MKKQKLVLTGLVGFAFLFGCNQVDTMNEVSAGEEGIFEYIGKSDTSKLSRVKEVKHKNTGCHYLITNNDGDYARAMVQMFIEKDGVTVPYCDKVGE